MRLSKLISEFVRYPIVAMEENRLNEAMALIQFNLQNQVEFKAEPKTMARLLSLCKDEHGLHHICEAIDMTSHTEQTEVLAKAVDAGQQPFINMICIDGDMSREGDACTYGSKEHKEFMQQAADNPMCRGHIIHINSGGGAAGTLFDYRDAINYCLSRGENVVAVVGDMAASAACFTANMTSRTFAENSRSEIGSMGMLAMFPTIADGTVLPNTNAVMHIRYAEQSTDKNLWYREASKGNMKPVDDKLRDDLAQTLANTKKDRPSILDEQMTGKLYKAADVMVSLVDEIGDVETAINWLMNDWDARQGAPIPVKEEADTPIISSEDTDPQNNPEGEPSHTDNPNGENNTATQQQTNNNIPTPMKTYSAIPAAIGEEPMEVMDGELTLQPEQAEALEQHLANGNNRMAMLQAQLDKANEQLAAKDAEHQAAIEAMNAEHATAIEAINAEHASAIENLNAEHATAIEHINGEHQAAIDKLNAAHSIALEGVNAQLTEANNNIAKANATIDENAQRIADLTAEVEQLNAAAHAAPAAGQQPANNGQQAVQPAVIGSASGFRYDPNLSAAENARRRKEAIGK